MKIFFLLFYLFIQYYLTERRNDIPVNFSLNIKILKSIIKLEK